MKVSKASFLFFCLLLINVISIASMPLRSQTKDSTLFYYKSITEIKDAKATIDAFSFFEKKSEIALSFNDTIKAAYFLELISLGQFKMGFYSDCESTTIKAFRLLNAIKKNHKIINSKKRLSNQLGMLYRKIEDFNNSYRYYKQALELNKKPVDKIAIITNIANNYADQEQYMKAIKSLNEYYEKALTLKDSGIKATYFDNIGFFQSKINNPMALKNMEIGLKIRRSIEDLTGLFLSYQHLSTYYLDRGNNDEAVKYALKTEIISNSLNSPTYKLKALKLNLKLENNPNFNKYLALNTQIEKATLLRENKFAAIKYNVSEKERIINENSLKLKSSELQKEKQKKLKLIYLFSALGICLLSVFLFLILKTKHKKDKIQQVYNTEARISKKVHDEVSNDIYHILTKLQSNEHVEEGLIDGLGDVYVRTRDISKENSVIEVTEEYGVLIKDLLMSFKNDTINIITKNLLNIDWDSIDTIKKTMLYRVLQELMVNMKKHSKASLVVIDFKQTYRNIIITYNDNGVGGDIKKGTGIHNVENRIKSINGAITFDTSKNKGLKVKITL